MSKFTLGMVVCLKSDLAEEGAIISVNEDGTEPKYQVFTKANGIQTYYESQLQAKGNEINLKSVNYEEFNADLTASLIRTPAITSLYSLNTGRIDFIPHQFRPVLKFIRSDRPRLLIADGVGVGKTIEAGLVLKELKARSNLDSVLIICPRPLITERKWEYEMKRFDEDFSPLDGEAFRYCIKETDYDGEWPDKYKKAVLPYSLFDEACLFGHGRAKGLLQLDPPPKFDLVIVDEAHHIRNTSTYAYHAVKQFCDNAGAVIFLTATPVQLEYDDLFTMLNLLRPDLIIDKDTFHKMAEPNGNINKAATTVRKQQNNWQQDTLNCLQDACDTDWGKMVFQNNPTVTQIFYDLRKSQISQEERVRLISDIENLHTFSNIISRTRRRDIADFTVRKATTIEVEFTPAQMELHNRILEIMHDIFANIHNTENTVFMMTTIRRQVASCLFGLTPMLEDILNRHLLDLTDDFLIDNEEIPNSVEIRNAVNSILELAKNLPPDDPKLDSLIQIINDKQNSAKNKIMVFSTFRHTLNYLCYELQRRELRTGLIHGGVNDDERRELRRRFELQRDDPESIDVLLFSEVGCEGLDYQFCDCMVNYDLPWNPMRIEQRIGRIDRNGQASESVSIFNIVTPGTIDYDIYTRCLLRIGIFKESVGDCEEILGSISAELRAIVENFQLTDAERNEKIQQMTDNKIRLMNEQLMLEEKQRDLFGINVPKNIYAHEIEDATNYWLQPDMLLNMIRCYFKNRLGSDKDFLLGEKALKNLRISQETRIKLIDDLNSSSIPRSQETRQWEKILKSGELYIPVTFDAACAKDNPSANLISMTHPLVKQAAAHFENEANIVTALEVISDKIPAGEYRFSIYQWKYLGMKDDLQFITVCDDQDIDDALTDLLKKAHNSDKEYDKNIHCWDAVELRIHERWKDEIKKHREKTTELIRYKTGSLTTSHNARMAVLNEQRRKAKDSKIIMMKDGEIRNAIADYNYRMDELQRSAEKADVISKLVSYGVLFVCNA